MPENYEVMFKRPDYEKFYEVRTGDNYHSNRQNPFCELALNHPFRLVIVGPPHSGKSDLLKRMIVEKYYLAPMDKCIVFSPNIDQPCYKEMNYYINEIPKEIEELLNPPESDDEEDPDTDEEYQEFLKEEKENPTKNEPIVENLDDEEQFVLTEDPIQFFRDPILGEEGLYQLQNRPDKDAQYLVIFDDLNNDKRSKDMLVNWFSNARPHNISLIYLTQKLTVKTPTDVRSNASHFIFFKPRKLDLDNLCREFGDYPRFREILEAATKERFSYLLLNLLTEKPNEVFRRNFYEELEEDFIKMIN